MAHDVYFPLVEQVRAVLPDDAGPLGWSLRIDADWCFAIPPDYRPRDQGWKLHISATPLSSLLVLARVAHVLVPRRCAFKFAPTAARVVDLSAPKADRSGAGKFVTVYPDHDDQVAELASVLHQELEGLPGQHILSDYRIASESLVHLRFGVFARHPYLSDSGELVDRLRAPDGRAEPDRRVAWFCRPDWATLPIDELRAAPPADARLAGRYRVHSAIQHANKGGVFVADDEHTGTPVVLKQARAHVGSTLAGCDVQDFLRTEAAMFDRLSPHGLSPARVELFDVGDSLFLVAEKLSGTTLGDWVIGRLEPGRPLDEALPLTDVLPMARSVTRLMGDVHHLGVRIGDFTPANIMVDPAGSLRLIDLEAAALTGQRGAPMGTPGYLAPEARDRSGGSDRSDLYALGAVLFFLATGVDPVLMDGEPRDPVTERMGRWLAVIGPWSAAARRLTPVITALMVDEPQRRWDLDRVAADLARAHGDARPHDAARSPVRTAEELLHDLTAALVAAARHPIGVMPRVDPRAVQSGTAGRLAALVRLAPDTDAVELLIKELQAPSPYERVLPGLFSGAAGISWAAFDAARYRGDDPSWALNLARRLPTDAAMPDVFHGVAGAGLALLHLARSGAGTEFLEAARQCGETLVNGARPLGDGVSWPFPTDVDSALAGQTHFGLAHGTAGIGTFLLALYAGTGDVEYRDLATRAGDTLVANRRGSASAAWWYSDLLEQEQGDPPLAATYWCSGASGVGTYLIRLWSATGEPRWLRLAEAAGQTALADRWSGSTCYCHGLAGNGDFLLDLAAAVGPADPIAGDRHRAGAADLAALIAVRAARRAGRWVVPDDGHLDPAPGFLNGYTGTAAFLHRLVHGGPRLWLVDPVGPPIESPRLPAAVGVATGGENHVL